MKRVSTITLVGLIALGSWMHASSAERVSAPSERAYSAFSEDPARQFDFWIGVWDVNLRMQQDDLSFRDSVKARAHIYSVLGGKAIVELWDSGPIKGYSLRYYDPAQEQWVLWLNWPSNNRSSTSSLTGRFRHGRGAFYSNYTDGEGNPVIQRYAFNDITPFSLRWDDLRSTDGGKTWSKNWIMEFSRTAIDPVWPIADDAIPTFVDGSRCDDAKFRPYESIAGHWNGSGARLDAYRVLDGCAVIGFLTSGEREEFFFFSYDTRASTWEMSRLTDETGSVLQRYRSADDWSKLSAEGQAPVHWSVDGNRLTYTRGGKTLTLTR